MIKTLDRFFGFTARGGSFSKELIGALTTFLAMSYILAVQPGMLAAAGMSPGAVFAATAITSAITTIFMGFLANLPIAISAGMGLNAVFTFQLVLGGGWSWQGALVLFLLEGLVALGLAFSNIRSLVANAVPEPLKKAIPVGIGLFIALIGLTNGGILANDTGTIIGLKSLEGNWSAALALISIALTFGLTSLRVPGGILIAVVISAVIGIPLGVTHLPESWFSTFEAPYFGAVFSGFENAFTTNGIILAIVTIITLTLTDVFDTVGTAFGVASAAGLTDKDGNFPKMKETFIADSSGTIVGAIFGTSSATSYIESGAGVSAGARTGLSSIFVGLLFFVSLLLAPIFISIPGAATAGALFYVGFLMMQGIGEINFKDPFIGIPAFTTIAMMPFAYSITEGIAYGFVTYAVCAIFGNKKRLVSGLVWILSAVFLAHIILPQF
jgi:AGZA family xanthine/uracil permease-like MFS transporter